MAFPPLADNEISAKQFVVMNRMAGAAAGYAIMTLSIWADFDEDLSRCGLHFVPHSWLRKKLVRSFIQGRQGIVVRDRCDAYAPCHGPRETRNRIGDGGWDCLAARLGLCIHVLTSNEKYDRLLRRGLSS